MTRELKRYMLPFVAAEVCAVAILLAKPFTPEFAFSPSQTSSLLGWSALAFFIFSFAYTLRKRLFLQAPGHLMIWKSVHVALGLITFMLMLLHNSSLDGGLLSSLLLAICFAILFTGVYGMAQQGIVPKIMNETLLDPVYKSEVIEREKEFMQEINSSISSASPAFRAVYQRHILPCLSIQNPDDTQQKGMVKRLFGSPTSHRNAAVDDVRKLPEEERDLFYSVAEKALDVIERRRSSAYQRRMNSWLNCHIGFSAVMVVFLFYHIFSALYFSF